MSDSNNGANAPPKNARTAKLKPPWQKGASGNPRGSRTGSKHKSTVFAEALLKGETEGIVRKVVECALKGDPTCLKLALDRILPAPKTRPISFPLPVVHSTGDALSALTALVKGLSSGEILPEESQSLVETITAFIRCVEVAGLEDRLVELEKSRAEAERDRPRYDA
jgi:uncharacterized protein DUF5681